MKLAQAVCLRTSPPINVQYLPASARPQFQGCLEYPRPGAFSPQLGPANGSGRLGPAVCSALATGPPPEKKAGASLRMGTKAGIKVPEPFGLVLEGYHLISDRLFRMALQDAPEGLRPVLNENA